MESSSCPHDARCEITEQCRFCKHNLCPSCRITYKPTEGPVVEQYQCRPCTISNEQSTISAAILKAPLMKEAEQTICYEANIANVIASFAVGYIVPCCNTKEHCSAEISISNRFDIQRSASSIDSDGNTIL